MQPKNPNICEYQAPRIMLVDDSRAFLSGLRAILEQAGYRVVCHTSPLKALEDLTASAPDIVITDLEMPELHGLDFIKKARVEHALTSVPILVLTGSTDTQAMAQSIVSGADAFCSKETIRHTIVPQVLSLLRLKSTYNSAFRGKQLEAVQALIGTYKHEFGNTIAIFDGMLRKLARNNPAIKEDPAMASIQSAVLRFLETLNKLNELRHYEEQRYSEGAKMLKVG